MSIVRTGCVSSAEAEVPNSRPPTLLQESCRERKTYRSNRTFLLRKREDVVIRVGMGSVVIAGYERYPWGRGWSSKKLIQVGSTACMERGNHGVVFAR